MFAAIGNPRSATLTSSAASLRVLDLGNAEISGTLYIGAATVKSHLSNILTRLGLRDRAQAVVFAYESGLITPGHPDIGHWPHRLRRR